MRLNTARLGAAVAPIVGFLVPLALYLRTRAPTISWANGGADGGDLAAAVASLGVPHPPGYPTYTLIAAIWSALPLTDDLAGRLAVFSAVSAALACAVVAIVVARRAHELGAGAEATVGGLFAAVSWGLSPIAWSQATIVEVYAHGMLWIGLAIALLLRRQMTMDPRALAAVGLISGLGFGALPEMLLIALAAAALAVSWWHDPRRAAGRCAAVLVGGLLGLGVFAYLPLRAAAHPYVNWGDPSTPARFVGVVTASVYHPIAETLDAEARIGRVVEGLAIVAAQLGLAAPFAAVGVVTARRLGWPRLAFLLLAIGLTVLFRASYPVEGNIVYLLPATYVGAILGGLGLADILRRVGRARAPGARFATALVVLACFGLVALRTPLTLSSVDASQDLRADAFSRSTLGTLPLGAIVLTDHDETTFALWYRQALGERPDAVIVDARLLFYDWYREALASRHPDLDARAIRPGGLTALDRPVLAVRVADTDFRTITVEYVDAR